MTPYRTLEETPRMRLRRNLMMTLKRTLIGHPRGHSGWDPGGTLWNNPTAFWATVPTQMETAPATWSLVCWPVPRYSGPESGDQPHFRIGCQRWSYYERLYNIQHSPAFIFFSSTMKDWGNFVFSDFREKFTTYYLEHLEFESVKILVISLLVTKILYFLDFILSVYC